MSLSRINVLPPRLSTLILTSPGTAELHYRYRRTFGEFLYHRPTGVKAMPRMLPSRGHLQFEEPRPCFR